MSDKGWVGRALAAGGVRAAAFYVTTTYIIPLGAPIVTVVIGYASGVPWFGIWLGALAAFAFVSTGLLRFTEWRFRQKVHDKLAFAAVMVGKDISSGGITIGLRLHNSALFPIEFSLEQLLTRLGDKVPSKTTYDSPGTISIPAKGVGWFWDNAIKVDNPPKPGTIEGHMEYKLVYGRSGRLRYKLSGKKQIIIAFNEQGLPGDATWHEAV